MIMLEFDPKLNTNVGAYKILHLLNKNENFSLKGQIYEFFIDSDVSSRCPNLRGPRPVFFK
jgi:hypothetical protein